LTRPFDPDEVAAELQGEVVAAVERRGKYLVVRFRSGRTLLIHLRMTGSLRHHRNGTDEDDPHRRAVVRLDDGSDVSYRDVRRFGTWLLLEPGQDTPYLTERLGEEPLGTRFTPKALAARLANRHTSVKAAILDQRSAAGMGNIYADEALWRAKLNPLRPAGDLSTDEIRRLHRGIKDALRHGIKRQGTTLRDYRTPNGARGTMQDELRVYGRAGEPCFRCGTQIAKTRAAGRGTFYCPTCQPEPS
ncbi:MAG TPA: DNA-formamidopyrimidine glycosylase, partial [Gaiellaceae bacterium]|nr:DNA-formamidopyrimidine glycosylase [Gaiellaceae bacterium]